MRMQGHCRTPRCVDIQFCNNVLFKEFDHYIRGTQFQGLGFGPSGAIVYDNKDVFVLGWRRGVDCSNKNQSPLSKWPYFNNWLKWHSRILFSNSGRLTCMTCLHMLVCILKQCGPIIACPGNLMCCSQTTFVTGSRSTMKLFHNLFGFFPAYTSQVYSFMILLV